jgi:hypothetical protein
MQQKKENIELIVPKNAESAANAAALTSNQVDDDVA